MTPKKISYSILIFNLQITQKEYKIQQEIWQKRNSFLSSLVELPKFSFALNTSFSNASFFKYSIIDTGVLHTENNLSMSIFAADFAGASVNLKDWAFSLSISLLENYDRPGVEAKYE